MKAHFIAWNEDRVPHVWNGSAWVESRTEPEHRQKARLIELQVARENLMAMRNRFPGLEIQVMPVAEPRDVARLARGRRRS